MTPSAHCVRGTLATIAVLTVGFQVPVGRAFLGHLRGSCSSGALRSSQLVSPGGALVAAYERHRPRTHAAEPPGYFHRGGLDLADDGAGGFLARWFPCGVRTRAGQDHPAPGVRLRSPRRFPANPTCAEQPDADRGQGDSEDDPRRRHDQVTSSHPVPFPRLPVHVLVSAPGSLARVVNLSWCRMEMTGCVGVVPCGDYGNIRARLARDGQKTGGL